jgi:NADH dehydrogenase
MTIPNIVIVGGGAGGLELATKLGSRFGKKKRASITLVDQALTHIWKPLLHEVAAGTINAFHDEQNYFIHAAKHHYEFQLGSLIGLDRENKLIKLGPVINNDKKLVVPEREISYDYLVIAVGSTCNDFGTPGANEHCIYLDSRVKAESFHQQFLDNYIAAHSMTNNDIDDNKLPIVIIGAGATGVELAAELHYAAQQYVKLGLDEITSKNVSITLIEAAPRILAALPEKIAMQAAKELRNIGVNVLTGEQVVEITAEEIKTKSGKIILSPLKAWCAGVKAPDFLKTLDGLEVNRLNQLVVKTTLQTSQDDTIFAFGDCAMCQLDSGIVPPRAQAAHQQARLMMENIERVIKNQSLKSFVYTDRGSLISLSKEDSVGTLMGRLMGNVNVHGLLAKLIYTSLYRSHQYSIHGFYKTAVLIVSDLLGRSTGQRTKLH